MRILLLNALLLFCFINLKAQDYHPLIKPNKIWTIGCVSSIINPFNTTYRTMSIGDTTEINGLIYYEVNTDEPYAIFMREDSVEQKVYTYLPDSNAEYLTFDFNVNINDTIFLPGALYNMGITNETEEPVLIQSIDSVEIESGIFRKRIRGFGNSLPYEYIEQLGGAYGVLTPIDWIFESNCNLLSVVENSEYIFNIGIEEELNPIHIYYNTYSSSINIDFSEANTEGNYELLNGLGQIIKKGQLTEKISIEDINQGLYIFRYYTSHKPLGAYKFVKK